MDSIMWIWLIGIIAFIVLEAVTYQIVSIWFALGAAAAMIAKAAGADFTWQMVVFIAVSALFLICLRPVSKKLLKNNTIRTNAESLIGKEVLVTEEVNNLHGTGKGKTGGMEWTIRADGNEVIPAGETVTAERIEGVKLIVKRKES